MNYAQQQRNPMRHIVGIGLVVLLHLFIIYALINGLGANIIAKMKDPLVTKIVQEEKKVEPPPPPPPPPPPIAPPPPPYIPPPEVVIQTPPPPNNAITAVTHAAPPPQTFAPTPKAAPAVADSGPSSSPAVGSSRPEYPPEYEDAARPGSVTVTCNIQPDGRPTGCTLGSVSGGAAFGRQVMSWLNSGTAKYKPAIRNGHAVEQSATLRVSFQAPSE